MLLAALVGSFVDRTSGRTLFARCRNPPLWLFASMKPIAWMAGEDTATGQWAVLQPGTPFAFWPPDEVLPGVNHGHPCLG
ncbi:hypothetical protein, partial [Methylobacterium sp. J-076]|uniref:hypothetical protein n=1 Tax=Methylobacterium sp. J-076 TaxID=2836655 RepID=UPI001FBBEDA7